MKIAIVLVLVLGLLESCNPTRRIIFKNNSGDRASFYWIMKDRDSLWRSPFFVASTDSSGFTLGPSAPQNRAEMSFGFGSWSPDLLNETIKDVKSMHLLWKRGAVDLNSREEIMSFLLARRRGIDKHRIVIEFE
jgi:hypothetical protein